MVAIYQADSCKNRCRMARMKIDDLISSFEAHLSDDPGTSPRTAEFYVADLREFARFLEV